MTLSSRLLLGLFCFAASLVQAQVLPAGALERARQAKTAAEALAALGISNPELGKKVLLEVPDVAIADKPFVVKVTSRMAGTDLMLIMVERGAEPVLKLDEFSPGVDRSLSAEVKLGRTSRVRAVVRSGGTFYQVSREIKIAEPGWGRP